MNASSDELWPAPTADHPVQASVRLPGSKSITNRALILAALADGPSTLRRPLVARDSALMVGALRSLGTEVTDAAEAWTVTPSPVRGGGHVDCGLAGTVMRFVPPVAVLAEGPVSLDGDPYARKRPMGTVVDALRTLGAEIDDDGRGALPFVIRGTGGLAGGAVTIDASASSQFVSSLLLAGTRYDKGVTIHHDGKPIPSVPHIEMTVGMLRAAGVEIDDATPNTWRIEPGPVAALDLDIEPDLSNAAPFLAAALVTGGEVHVPGWPQRTTQPGAELRDLLGRMGAEVVLDATGLTVRGTGTVHGLDADLHDVSELTPVLAAVAALADGPSHLRGVGHIRGHETDRLAALATELNALGGAVTETEDGLTIQPRPLRDGVFHTYADHRMAQAGAVVGLSVRGVEVENIATTAKTMPEFAELWARMVTTERAA